MVKYCILAVEGPHDQAFVGMLLSMYGLKKFKGQRTSIDPFWIKFVPDYSKYANLYVRLDMPSILFSPTHSVAIYQGEGSKLCSNIKARMGEHDPYVKDIHAFGLVVDADTNKPDLVAKQKSGELRELFPDIPNKPGIIAAGNPRTGIYVIPDNNTSGVLDSTLLKCASIVYPDHKIGAERFLSDLDTTHKQEWGPFDHQKAVIASIVSVLKPGMANTASISQDKWICADTIKEVNEVTILSQFLKNLLELPER